MKSATEQLLAFRAETTELFSLTRRIPTAIAPLGEAALAPLDAEFLFERDSPTRSWQRESGLTLAAATILNTLRRPLGVWQERVKWLASFIAKNEHTDAEDTLTADLDPVIVGLLDEDRDAVLLGGATSNYLTNAHRHGANSQAFRAAYAAYVAQSGTTSKWASYQTAGAATTLATIGTNMLPEIAEALPKATSSGAEVFARTLGLLRDPRSATLLVDLLGHSSKAVKAEALLALGALGPLAESAVAIGATSKKKAIREACEQLVSTLSGPKNPFEELLTSLDEATKAKIEKFATDARTNENYATTRELTASGLKKFGAPYAAWVLQELLTHLDDYKYRTPASEVSTRLAESEELRAAAIPLAVHFVTHIPNTSNYSLEEAVGVVRPLINLFAPALAVAMAGPAGKPLDFPARAKAFELLDRAASQVPTPFWIDAIAESSKTIRGIAARALAGREEAVAAIAVHLTAKKADVRSQAAEFLASEARAGAGAALRNALAAEKDAKVAALLERAIAAVPDRDAEGAEEAAETPAKGGKKATKSAAKGEAPKADAGEEGSIHALLAAQRKGKLPKFLATTTFPSVVTRAGATLNENEILVLLTRLANEAVDLEDPVARTVRAALDDASATAFGDAIYKAWLHGGRDSKQKWAVFQLGVFGSETTIDDVGMRLGIEASTGGHHFVGWCLEAFARHGRIRAPKPGATDNGLSWISYWARAATTEGLGTKARDTLARERKSRSLNDATFAACINRFIASEAADRAIPDFDLTATYTFKDVAYRPLIDGKRVLLQPVAGGEPLAALPKKGSKDDAEKNRFDEFAARVERLLVREGDRLEQAMVGGRIWPAPLFLALAAHPIVKHLFAGLVLEARSETNSPLTFRAALDGFVAADYAPVSAAQIEALGTVVIPHRIDFDEKTRTAWSEHFAESKVIPPFEQLGRELYTDLKDLEIDASRKMKPNALVARLIEARWQHGRPQDAGIFYDSWRLFAGYGIRVVLHHGGLAISGGQSWQTEPIGLDSVVFEDLEGSRVAPKAVPAVVRSEIARDLKAILR